jgi:integrase/recombinase XerD
VRTREAAERFFQSLRAASESTQERARRVLPLLVAHLGDDVRGVTEADLATFTKTLSERPLAPATRSATLSMVRRFFSFLYRNGDILTNPALSLALPRVKRLPRSVLSGAAAARLMAAPFSGTAIGLRDRAILELLYGSGLRLNEAVRVDVQDLDLSRRVLLIRNGKGRKDRVVPVTGRAVAALELYLRQAWPELSKGETSALFLNRFGQRLGGQGLRVRVKWYAKAIGERVTPHGLRHACATHLLRGRASIRHVQALLGHKDMATTALYSRVAIEDLRELVGRLHPRSSGLPGRAMRRRVRRGRRA